MLSPHMSSHELELLMQYAPKNGKILEFGSSGSTYTFMQSTNSTLVTVESDRDFLTKLGKDPLLAKCVEDGRLLLLHGDIGPTKIWGNPIDGTRKVEFLNYHHYIWEKIDNKFFDLIFVDGRFRVACVLQSLLRCKNSNVIFYSMTL